MHLILVPGLWLDGGAWDATVAALEARGHTATPVTLPGQGDGADPASVTLADQVAAVVAAVDAAPEPPLLVGHSAASGLAWLVADARPEALAGVAMVGGWPAAEGSAYAAFFDCVDGVMPWPGWEPFAGADSADLDDAAKEVFTARAVPVPEGVATATVSYADPRRRDVPVTAVCPEYSPEDLRGFVAAGDVPELGEVASLTYVDLDTGHWPMLTAPEALAEALVGATLR